MRNTSSSPKSTSLVPAVADGTSDTAAVSRDRMSTSICSWLDPVVTAWALELRAAVETGCFASLYCLVTGLRLPGHLPLLHLQEPFIIPVPGRLHFFRPLYLRGWWCRCPNFWFCRVAPRRQLAPHLEGRASWLSAISNLKQLYLMRDP